jgi:hypothetical protein
MILSLDERINRGKSKEVYRRNGRNQPKSLHSKGKYLEEVRQVLQDRGNRLSARDMDCTSPRLGLTFLQ